MSLIHSYISSKLNTIRSSPYGYILRGAIADSIEYIDKLIANSGSGNTFVVCTQEQYDALSDDEKTASAYFIVESE